MADNEEVRHVDPKTGAEKGTKKAMFDLIPAKAMFEIAEHFGAGAKKYSKHNWRKGYDWGYSFAAMMRHAWAFWNGEDIDEETGSKHIVAAAWHCIILSIFMDEHPDKDDRFKVLQEVFETPLQLLDSGKGQLVKKDGKYEIKDLREINNA